MKENRKSSTCNRSDLQTSRTQPVMPTTLPDHRAAWPGRLRAATNRATSEHILYVEFVRRQLAGPPSPVEFMPQPRAWEGRPASWCPSLPAASVAVSNDAAGANFKLCRLQVSKRNKKKLDHKSKPSRSWIYVCIWKVASLQDADANPSTPTTHLAFFTFGFPANCRHEQVTSQTQPDNL